MKVRAGKRCIKGGGLGGTEVAQNSDTVDQRATKIECRMVIH